MWQKLNNVNLPLDFSETVIRSAVQKLIGKCGAIELYRISLDSRRKDNIHYVATVLVDAPQNSKLQPYILEKKTVKELLGRVHKGIKPIIVGSGPCGMFCALVLAEAGLEPIVIERGASVDERASDIMKFSLGGELNEESNMQFGEGGAGTFSDGKLNTGISSEYVRVMLNEYVRFGANTDILYNAKPHIGTDVLKVIVKNMRNHIEGLGGEFRFNTKLENINIEQGKLKSITVNAIDIVCNCLILACGHSARDTMEMLYNQGVAMEAKSFAIGARIEHEQEMIDTSQYGKTTQNVPVADYKLAYKTADGRGCFTFCMCPGGYVMPATSERNAVVTNGMSEYRRDSGYANSAVLVGVNPSDYGDSVLGGIEFQRKYEKLAYAMTMNTGEYVAPAIRVKDFINHSKSTSLNSVKTTYSRGVTGVDMDKCLPSYVAKGMREGLVGFGQKIRGFDTNGILIGVETRTSSPIRILRGEDNQSINVRGLYPCGEGAGYAGGITSSAVDGIKVALSVLNK